MIILHTSCDHQKFFPSSDHMMMASFHFHSSSQRPYYTFLLSFCSPSILLLSPPLNFLFINPTDHRYWLLTLPSFSIISSHHHRMSLLFPDPPVVTSFTHRMIVYPVISSFSSAPRSYCPNITNTIREDDDQSTSSVNRTASKGFLPFASRILMQFFQSSQLLLWWWGGSPSLGWKEPFM